MSDDGKTSQQRFMEEPMDMGTLGPGSSAPSGQQQATEQEFATRVDKYAGRSR